jgi:hypothetical protein
MHEDVEIFPITAHQHDRPNWDPLQAFLPLDLCERFMWMHEAVLDDGTHVQAYKHGDTRLYLYLDEQARPFEYLGSEQLRRIRRCDGIEHVFTAMWVLEHADADERQLLRDALRTAIDNDNADRVSGSNLWPSSPAAPLRFVPSETP